MAFGNPGNFVKRATGRATAPHYYDPQVAAAGITTHDRTQIARPLPSGGADPRITTYDPPQRPAATMGGYDPYAGGGGGGGYGDGYGASATPNIGQDPAYLAFLRALGIEKADLGQSAEDRIAVINREVNRRLPDIAQQGLYAREGISGNFESRGVFRSGKHNQSLARQRADEGQQVGALQGAAADQIFLINQELGRRKAAINRQLAEQSLTSAGNVYA